MLLSILTLASQMSWKLKIALILIWQVQQCGNYIWKLSHKRRLLLQIAMILNIMANLYKQSLLQIDNYWWWMWSDVHTCKSVSNIGRGGTSWTYWSHFFLLAQLNQKVFILRVRLMNLHFAGKLALKQLREL